MVNIHKDMKFPDDSNAQNRLSAIHAMQKLAVKYGRCREMIDGQCTYPHCGCLFEDGKHLDPVTGKPYP